MSIKFKFFVPKGILDLHYDKGALLDHLASLALDTISERTDRSRDANGIPFQPYRDQLLMEDGKPVRDDKGRFVRFRRNDDVTLRSMDKVQPGRRMRDNIVQSPKVTTPSTRAVYLKPAGSRDGLSHFHRARTASGFVNPTASNKEFAGRPVRRKFLGLTDFEWTAILSSIRQDGITAAIDKRRLAAQAAHTRFQKKLRNKIEKNIRKQQRTRKKKEIAAKRAARNADSKARSNARDAQAKIEWQSKQRLKRQKKFKKKKSLE